MTMRDRADTANPSRPVPPVDPSNPAPAPLATIVAICISEARGTAKRDVGAARLIADHGIEGDAHAGNWHRQVSLLSLEKVDAFRARGALVEDGAFGENLLLRGIDLARLPVGTRLSHEGGALLEVTQIGKRCHQHCAIYDAVGDCIMPREGIFARVLVGGAIRKGDALRMVMPAADGAVRGEEDVHVGASVSRRDPDGER